MIKNTLNPIRKFLFRIFFYLIIGFIFKPFVVGIITGLVLHFPIIIIPSAYMLIPNASDASSPFMEDLDLNSKKPENAIYSFMMTGDSSSTVDPHAPHTAPTVPTLEETRRQLDDFLSSYGTRKAKKTFVDRVEKELNLENASPQKLGAILSEINKISSSRETNSGQNAAALLTSRMANWSEQ